LIGFDFDGEALLATTFAAIYGAADLLDAVVGWIFVGIGPNGDGCVALNIGACIATVETELCFFRVTLCALSLQFTCYGYSTTAIKN
jgi:hypothetical protein